MRKPILIAATALIAATGFGSAASAQPMAYGHHNAGRPTPVRDANIRNDIWQLNRNIDRAVARRTISKREATGLRRESAQLQRLYTSYARNGLTRAETSTLRARVDRVQYALRAERNDRDRRRG